MGKDKQRKKKERERRVAQKKLADAQKRAQEKTVSESSGTLPKTNRLTTGMSVHKADYAPAVAKKPIIRRRSGGG